MQANFKQSIFKNQTRFFLSKRLKSKELKNETVISNKNNKYILKIKALTIQIFKRPNEKLCLHTVL
jgi:hypothetical protein